MTLAEKYSPKSSLSSTKNDPPVFLRRNQLVQCADTAADYCEIHEKKRESTVWAESRISLCVEPGGTHSNYWALNR
jgi:hypothetical protein